MPFSAARRAALTTVLAALALAALALAAGPALAGSPSSVTRHCTASADGINHWVGWSTDANGNDAWWRAETATLGGTPRTKVLHTDQRDTCGADALNPQTSDAGLAADHFDDLVVLHLSDMGEPEGVIAIFDDGRIEVNMQEADAATARALLLSIDRVDQASVIYHQVDEGALKVAFAAIF